MKATYKFLGLVALITLLASATAMAQRPRSVSEPEQSTTPTRPAPAPAPPEVKVKYEGGVLGYSKKIDGTIFFDDQNKRLLFRDKTRHEVISIPYQSIAAAFADTKSKRPTSASVISSIPLIYTFPAAFIRKKYRYLTLQYDDPDTHVSGITSFKMENKEILESVLYTLANKAGLTPRGEAFIRKDSTAGSQKTTP
ncbi:MAG TPA: hypothetical protein VF708_17245 [Pyrinomonadaceae bacterium]|jgi:hypothetical protein